jgi:purine-nucleoside phosphorylase
VTASRPPRLLLAAFRPELAGLDEAPPRGWTCATAGVGALAAALATARLLDELRPERVLFVGTCGAYDGRLAVFDLVAAAEVIATSQDEALGRAYRPEVERTRWRPGFALPLRGEAVAVTPAVTTDAEGAAALARLAAVEHLELSGVFAACEARGVPVAAALAVANRAGPGAHVEWRAHHAEASRRLVLALEEEGVL